MYSHPEETGCCLCGPAREFGLMLCASVSHLRCVASQLVSTCGVMCAQYDVDMFNLAVMSCQKWKCTYSCVCICWFCLSPPLCLSGCLSVCLSVSLSLFSLCLCVSRSLCLCVCFAVPESPRALVPSSVCLSVCLSLSLSLSLSLPL